MSLAKKVHLLLQSEEGISCKGRFATSQEVEIYCFGYKLHTTKALNIGADGLYVQSDLSTLPAHSYLEVGFRLKSDCGSELFRIPVFRDLVDEGGTELLFVFPMEHQDVLEDSLASHFKTEESSDVGAFPSMV